MKRIKGHYIKEGKNLEKGKLYIIRKNRIVVFEEEETDDIVNIHFNITKEQQYGIYSSEFKPSFIEDNGVKKADILIFIVDEENKHLSSWIIDVKKTVGGEDVIYHLIEQLMETFWHEQAITLYLEDFQKELNIGYITRDLQSDRIQGTIEEKKFFIKKQKESIKNMSVLLAQKIGAGLLKEEAKLRILEDFQNNRICIGANYYPIQSYISEQKEGKFICDLKVVCF